MTQEITLELVTVRVAEAPGLDGDSAALPRDAAPERDELGLPRVRRAHRDPAQ